MRDTEQIERVLRALDRFLDGARSPAGESLRFVLVAPVLAILGVWYLGIRVLRATDRRGL